jgi:hypothetical protein
VCVSSPLTSLLELLRRAMVSFCLNDLEGYRKAKLAPPSLQPKKKPRKLDGYALAFRTSVSSNTHALCALPQCHLQLYPYAEPVRPYGCQHG